MAYLHGRSLATIAQQLCDGGADLIQLRAKHFPVEEVRRLAAIMNPILERAGVGLVINDHINVAKETGAPYCHLGQEDFFGAGYHHVSELGPTSLKLGLSSHSAAQAGLAVEAGAAYLGVGPVFATQTKPTALPVTLDYVRWAAAHLDIPWFAIGGINLDTLGLVLAAGARRICVVSGILKAPDVLQACQAYRQQLDSAT